MSSNQITSAELGMHGLCLIGVLGLQLGCHLINGGVELQAGRGKKRQRRDVGWDKPKGAVCQRIGHVVRYLNKQVICIWGNLQAHKHLYAGR